MNNPYKILGISPNASEAQIKSAFRRLAKETHPDLNAGNTHSSARFIEIAEAYAVLSDPITKAEIDMMYTRPIHERSEAKDSSAHFKQARDAASDIEQFIYQMRREAEPYRAAAKKSLYVGLAWLVGGIAVTGASYLEAVNNGSGSYFITWGAILFGGIQAVRSFMHYSKINSALEEAERDMWKAIGL